MLLIRRAFTLLEFVVVLAIIGILVAILMPVFQRTYCNERSSNCRSNLKQIGLGFLQYAQDYDEKFPIPKTNSKTTWATSIRPYLSNWDVFNCPSARPLPPQKVYLKPPPDQTTDYFYNRRLALVNRMKLVAPKSIILGGDGKDNAFLGSSISQLPIDWRDSADSPSRRHPYRKNLTDKLFNRNLDRANYLFADGHVTFAMPEKVTLEKSKNASNYTFLPQQLK